MVKEVLVPDIGDYQNVEVIELMVKVGDVIAVDDELLTIETDKAAMAIPSSAAGTITQLNLKVGDKVSRGTLILTLDEAAASSSASAAASASTATATPSPASLPNTAVVEEIINVPDIGMSAKVEIIEVQVQVGQQITAEQPLITLESEKAAMEIPAPKSGTIIEIFVKAGDKVGVGDPIVKIAGQSSSSVSKSIEPSEPAKAIAQPKSAPSLPVPTTTANVAHAPGKHHGLGHAGPAVRRFARELGVELTKVAGSARKGRILRADITKYVKEVLTAGHTSHHAHHAKGSDFNVAAMPDINFADFGSITMTPLSRIKKLSGNFLHRNWVRIPHVTQFDEADITEMENFRASQKALADKHGIKLTPIVFLMKAVVAALKAYPIFNSSLSKDGEQLIMKNYYHIGVAVDTPNGLVVPVVRDVDTKGLFELAQDLARISIKARDGKLTAHEMQGGCFSISSLGGIGGTAFTPIVNAPEVAILGVSKAKMQPVYKDNVFVPRLMLPLSLSYDHRVIDGADAARFCAFISDQLSDIRRLLL